MRYTKYFIGLVFLGAGISAQAGEATRFDYLGLPIESGPTEVSALTASDTRSDYLGLPVQVETKTDKMAEASIEDQPSVDNDCLGLPVETTAMHTADLQ